MAVSTVAFRYAKSLFDLAQEKSLTEDIQNDMLFFKRTLAENRQLALVLKNPIVRSEKKNQVVKAIFGERINPLSMAFFGIVARKNRESILDAIAAAFIDLYDESKGIKRATVTTTVPLTDELRAAFKALVTKSTGAKGVELEELTNPNLIGGYVLRIGDEQLDASLRSQLNELKLEFLN